MIIKGINFIKNYYKNKKNFKRKIKFTVPYNEWANIYHDSIRGKDYLQNLPLNIGRWSGNYVFFMS